MAVPADAAAGGVGAIALHEPHAAFHQSPGQNAVLGKGGLMPVLAVRAVKFSDVLQPGLEISTGHGELHAGGQFVAGNAGGEIGVAGKGRLRLGFSAQSRPRGGVLCGAILGSFQNLIPVLLKVPWRREEAAGPVIRAALRHASRILNGYEGRQVLVFTAERVIDPGAHARKPIEHVAGVHEIFRRPMRVGSVGERVKQSSSASRQRGTRSLICLRIARAA